jgi:hypothetical protein
MHVSKHTPIPKADAERVVQLKRKIWAHQAERLLYGKKDPRIIAASTIEDHRGRQAKAIRLLGEYINYSHTIGERHYKTTYHEIQNFEAESAELATGPTFIDLWQEFHDKIYGHLLSEQNDFDAVGYLEVSDLSPENILYVYWHQDEFDFIKEGECVKVFPSAKRTHRIKCMLRSVIEHEHQLDFASKLETYLGIPHDSLKRDNSFSFTVRNFCAKAADLTEERYFGENGFRDEYKHYRDYFEALLYNLQRLDALVKTKGGQDVITREMRKATIKELLDEAPLRLDYTPPEKHTYGRDPEQTLSMASVFIMRHSALFDYDTLYGSDESISYIEGDTAQIREDRTDEHVFSPNEEEVTVIQSAAKERAACSARMISKISPST